jgi:hypothetical protein
MQTGFNSMVALAQSKSIVTVAAYAANAKAVGLNPTRCPLSTRKHYLQVHFAFQDDCSMRRNVKFQPSLDGLEPRISLSAVHVAAVVSKVDDDPGDPMAPLPEPEPAPPPYPGPDGPLPWPPIPPSGPVGPGAKVVAMDTLMPEKGGFGTTILEPVTKPVAIMA